MRLSFNRWRPSHLILASIGYWVALAAVKLAPGAIAAWRLSGPDVHGTVSASLDNTVLKVAMSSDSGIVWSGAVSLGALVLMVAGPPLVLWFLWVIRRPEPRGESAPEQLSRGDAWPGARPERARDEVPLSDSDKKAL